MSSKPHPAKPQSPFAKVEAQSSVRFGIGTMLLATFVFGAMASALFYATRVPMLRTEFESVFGTEPSSEGVTEGRSAHLMFLLFVYSAPLLLTGLLGLGLKVIKGISIWLESQSNQEEEQPWDADLIAAGSIPKTTSQQFRIVKEDAR